MPWALKKAGKGRNMGYVRDKWLTKRVLKKIVQICFV